MRFAQPKRPKDLVNITPLIDVVFILLVFFMLAGAIEKPDPLDVAPPQSAAEEAGDVEDLVILIDADGRLAFNGQPLTNDADLVRAATIWIAYQPATGIQLKADAEVDAVRVIQVMDLLREAGARSLVLLTVGGSV